MPEYYVILTEAGQAAVAAAQVPGGDPVVFADFAAGDGGGLYHEPAEDQIALVNEVWRGAVNRVYVHPENANWTVVEAMIPMGVGGWDIRETGLFDAGGVLLAVGKYPLTNKPAPGSGSEKDLYVRMVMAVSNGGDVIQQISADQVMATQKYVDDHAGRTDNPHQVTRVQLGAEAAGTAAALVGNHEAADDPHPQYETSAEAQAKINAAVAALVASSPAALDTLNELAAALGDDPNFAATMTNALAAKETPAGAQAKVDAHAGVEGAVHGANQMAAANSIARRDSGGRLEAAKGLAGNDVVNMGQFVVSTGVDGSGKPWRSLTLPDGTIFKWGECEFPSVWTKVFFPVGFPTACDFVFTQNGNSAPNPTSVDMGEVSERPQPGYFWVLGVGLPDRGQYFAIGR